MSMVGVTVTQLFRLQHSISPDLDFGFFVLGKPVGVTFIGASIVMSLVGAFRFYRQQNAMLRGKVYAGGWEVVLIMLLSIAVSAGI